MKTVHHSLQRKAKKNKLKMDKKIKFNSQRSNRKNKLIKKL